MKGEKYERKGKLGKAIECYKKSADMGNVDAMVNFAEFSPKTESNMDEILRYCRMAINAGTKKPYPYFEVVSHGTELKERIGLSGINDYIDVGENALNYCECENEYDEQYISMMCLNLGTLHMEAEGIYRETEGFGRSVKGLEYIKLSKTYLQIACETSNEKIKELAQKMLELADGIINDYEEVGEVRKIEMEAEITRDKAFVSKLDSIFNKPLLNMIPGFSVGAAMYNAGRAIGDAIIDRDVNKASQGVVDGINTIKGLKGW